jgi:hypothetical protein
LNGGRGHNIKYLPHAFTEHGAIQAANVLNSPRAVAMGVYVVRAFVHLRELLSSFLRAECLFNLATEISVSMRSPEAHQTTAKLDHQVTDLVSLGIGQRAAVGRRTAFEESRGVVL